MGQKPADIPEDVLRKLYLEDKQSQYQIAEKLGCSQAAVWRRLKKHAIPLRTKAEAGILFSKYERHDFDGDDRLKAYLLGFCKGDVHAYVRDSNGNTIRLLTATTKPEQIELFESLFAPYGRVYVSGKDKRGAIHMNAFVNKSSMAFLLDEIDNIPEWVLGDMETFFAFFAGYTDAEGHIGVYNGYAVFKIDAYNKNIALQSYKMLRDVGIDLPEPSICTPKGVFNPQGGFYRNDLWRLKIGAKDSLLKLFTYMSPHLRHAKRIRDMHAAVESINLRNSRPRRKVNKVNKNEQNS